MPTTSEPPQVSDLVREAPIVNNNSSQSRRGLLSALASIPLAPYLSSAEASAATELAESNFYSISKHGSEAAAVLAGESNTPVGHLFIVNDDLGNIIYYEMANNGSIEVGRSGAVGSMSDAEALSHVGFNQGSPYIKTRSAMEKLRELGASANDFGAKGDYSTDDADAIEEAFNYFSETGGQWHIPPGCYLIKRMINIRVNKPQLIIGFGQRGVYPGRFEPLDVSGLSTFVPVHDGRAAFEFTGKHGANGISLRNLAVTSLEYGSIPAAAFGWLTDDGFTRNYEFERVSINGFTSAFDTYSKDKGNSEVGIFRASHCNIHRNSWIARSLNNTQWNGFSFIHNESGQNGYLPGQGGISISGHNVHIHDNILEGTRDPIKITGGFLGINIQSNYLESCIGRANIHISGAKGHYKIGPNTPLSIDYSKLKHNILITNCGPGEISGPYWPDNVSKTRLPVIGNSILSGNNIINPQTDTTEDGYARLDGFDMGQTYMREPELISKSAQRVTVCGRELAPWSGQPIPVEEYATSGSGAITTRFPILGDAGHWIAVSWLFKRIPDTAELAEPYISLSLNGILDPGSRDYVFNDFNEYWRDGEWILATCAIRALCKTSSLIVHCFPHGVSPSAGRKTRFLKPLVYLSDTVNKVIPYIDEFIARSVEDIPNAPGFLAGDTLINASPSLDRTGDLLKLEGGDSNWVYR